MLVVRDVFTAKPGQASRFAKLMQKAAAAGLNARVMTDLVGDYNTVVMEYQVQNLAEFEQKYNEYRSGKITADPKLAEEMSHYAELWQSGRREIFQVVE